MLPKRNRLTKHEFSSVFDGGKRIHGETITIIYSPTQDISKIGVTVSKKVAPGAIRRNLLRRRLYSLAKVDTSFNIIIIAKKGIEQKSFTELVTEYQNLLKSIK